MIQTTPPAGAARIEALPPTGLGHLLRTACLGIMMASALSGCTVLAVVDTAASVAVGTVGLAADAAIGTVRITGKAVGAAADAVLPAAK